VVIFGNRYFLFCSFTLTIMKNLQEWILLLLPALVGYGVSRACSMEADAAPLKAQPPGWVFGVVWPVLYLSIGYCWLMARRSPGMRRAVDIIFIANLISINSWIWLYNCKESKDEALWSFVPSIATAVMMIIVVGHATKSWWPAVLLAPYVAWLTFASQLNFARVTSI